MKILLANQFYPPDMAPTGQHLHDLARCLVARGHSVRVLCSRRSYDGGGEYAAEETLDGVEVRRLSAFGFGRRGAAARLADYLSFHLAAVRGAKRYAHGFDLTLCLTTPPYVGWTVRRGLRGREARIAHWVMDLYPDVLAAHGKLSTSSSLYGALERLTRLQFRRASLVLALGPRMRARVLPYLASETRLDWVPLWGTVSSQTVDPAAAAAWRVRRGWAPDECVLLYSGNMGLGHRLGEFLSAASELGGRGPLWAFAGGGRRRSEVEAFMAAQPSARVQLLPYVAQEDVAASLSAADVHLVSLRSTWQGLIVPSKLQAAFTLGRPVIFVGPRENEAADWVLASGGGWVVAEDDVGGLLQAVASAIDSAERTRRGELARAFARQHFDRDKNTARIAELLENCAGDRVRAD